MRVDGLLRLAAGPAECRRITVRAEWNSLVHLNAREGVWRVLVGFAVELVGVVAVRRDHHILAAVALEVAEGSVLAHLRPLLDALFQRLHEHRAILFGPLVVFLVHLVRVALAAVEDALQFALFVQWIDEVAIDDPRAEVASAAELVHEVRLVPIEEVDLLDFVEQCRHLVKQALGKHAGEPASGGFARWKHVVLHCFRLEEDHSYRETPNRLEYMAEIRDVLDLDRYDLPDYSTIYKSFDRLKMWVWRALLR